MMEATKMAAQLSPEEKQEALFQKWLSPKDPQGNDLKFQSPDAAKQYKDRVNRIKDALQLKKRPARDPGLQAVLLAGSRRGPRAQLSVQRRRVHEGGRIRCVDPGSVRLLHERVSAARIRGVGAHADASLPPRHPRDLRSGHQLHPLRPASCPGRIQGPDGSRG